MSISYSIQYLIIQYIHYFSAEAVIVSVVGSAHFRARLPTAEPPRKYTAGIQLSIPYISACVYDYKCVILINMISAIGPASAVEIAKISPDIVPSKYINPIIAITDNMMLIISGSYCK